MKRRQHAIPQSEFPSGAHLVAQGVDSGSLLLYIESPLYIERGLYRPFLNSSFTKDGAYFLHTEVWGEGYSVGIVELPSLSYSRLYVLSYVV